MKGTTLMLVLIGIIAIISHGIGSMLWMWEILNAIGFVYSEWFVIEFLGRMGVVILGFVLVVGSKEDIIKEIEKEQSQGKR